MGLLCGVVGGVTMWSGGWGYYVDDGWGYYVDDGWGYYVDDGWGYYVKWWLWVGLFHDYSPL